MMLPRKRFQGTASFEDETVPLTFSAEVAEDGRLNLQIAPTSIRRMHFFSKLEGRIGRSTPLLTLSGTSVEGDLFDTKSASVKRLHYSTDAVNIELRALKATITLQLTEPPPAICIRLWLREFKAFRTPDVESELGRVNVWGATGTPKHDDVSGGIAVIAHNSVHDKWYEDADELLSFLHRGLSFASGKRLQAPVVEVFKPDRCIVTLYEGSPFESSLPVVHHLNLGPFLEALVRRFELRPAFPDILWVATGWLHSGAKFNEVRFLTSMIALEVVVDGVLPEKMTTNVPKAAFAPLRDSFLSELEKHELSDDSMKIFDGKLRQLNQRTLSQKLIALRNHYDLPTDQFAYDDLTGLTKARNKIVHSGRASDEDNLWRMIVMIREFISRIVLDELNYSNGFETYL